MALSFFFAELLHQSTSQSQAELIIRSLNQWPHQPPPSSKLMHSTMIESLTALPSALLPFISTQHKISVQTSNTNASLAALHGMQTHHANSVITLLSRAVPPTTSTAPTAFEWSEIPNLVSLCKRLVETAATATEDSTVVVEDEEDVCVCLTDPF